MNRILKKLFLKNGLFTYFVLIPFLTFTIYTLLVAKPRYVSHASIVVQNIGSNPEMSGVGALLAGIQGMPTNDLLLIKEYITSDDMMEIVDNKYNILSHWSNQWPDILYKLWNMEYREKSLSYYQTKVKTMLNTETGTLQVSVEAFDPEIAHNSLKLILEKSEEFVNNNGHKAANEQVRFIEEKLIELRGKLDFSREKMLGYQSTHNFFNPALATEQQARKIASLEETKIKMEAEYNAKKTFMSEEAPQMVTMAETIKNIDKQIQGENAKLIGRDSSVNEVSDNFKMLEGELALNMEAYKTGLLTYEKIKIEAARKMKQIITVVTPKRPEYAVYPEKVWNIFYAFIILLIGYGLLNLLKGIVKEHK